LPYGGNAGDPFLLAGEIMRRTIFFLFLLATLTLSACGGGANAAAAAAEGFLQALAVKNADQLTALTCSDYEQSAKMLMDSFEAVESKLEGLSCKETGKQGDATLVTCVGKLITTYQGENTELDLARFTFTMVQEGGDWRVCDFR
jgi:hypothetical protein